MSLIKYAAEIVKSYVARNEIPSGEVAGLLGSVHGTLTELSGGTEAASEWVASASDEPKVEEIPMVAQPEVVPVAKRAVTPFVPLEQAVTRDAIICLICGKSNKAIRGHLSRTHGMEIKSYQQMFSLPADFPMVSPAYSAKRRQLAIDAGLGEKLREGRAAKRR